MGGAPGMEPVGAARGAVSVMGSFIMAMNSSWCCMITWNSSGLCWPVDHQQQRSAPDTGFRGDAAIQDVCGPESERHVPMSERTWSSAPGFCCTTLLRSLNCGCERKPSSVVMLPGVGADPGAADDVAGADVGGAGI